MPNFNSLLNEQIRRLARREVKSQTKITRRLTAHYRRDIAACGTIQKDAASLRFPSQPIHPKYAASMALQASATSRGFRST